MIRELEPRTLLLWGEANETAVFDPQAAEFQHLLEGVPACGAAALEGLLLHGEAVFPRPSSQAAITTAM